METLMRYNKNKSFLIDVNPRFGGEYPATHLSGKFFKIYLD